MVIKIAATIAYLAMIAVNALANILPINGITTGAVSDTYANLFAPAGVTFSIWGIIYLLLGAYCVFQFTTRKNAKLQTFLSKLNSYFIFSSVINAGWIFAWHYDLIWLSVVLMIMLLVSLIKIAGLYRQETLSLSEKLFIKVPFGIYFCWITIATIANITTFLVSLGWNGFGINESVWTVIILGTGVLIGGLRMIKDNNLAYGLVLVWAYFGIWLKHTSENGFGGTYPLIINTTMISILILVIANGYLVWKRKAI